ncbi:MAG TPA: thiamine phosphate synthase [Xanthobacteraceae bacterium]|nr:thiamine phosphate synthase [Xanthobacteraceae bacterium]
MKLPDPPLLLVTDRRQAGRPLAEVIAPACAAGCRWISLREKDLPATEQIALARALLPIARQWGALLMLHGTAEMARAAGVDGVHLAAGSDTAEARAILGPGLVGASVHTIQEAAALAPPDVDYALAGPAYETASKPGYGPPLAAAGIAAIVRACRVPVFAIGGVTVTTVLELIQAGAGGIAVMGSMMRAPSVTTEAMRLLAALADARARNPKPSTTA